MYSRFKISVFDPEPNASSTATPPPRKADSFCISGVFGTGFGEWGQGRRSVAFLSTLDPAPHATTLEAGNEAPHSWQSFVP